MQWGAPVANSEGDEHPAWTYAGCEKGPSYEGPENWLDRK